MTLARTQLATLSAARLPAPVLPGPVVAVQDDETQVVEHWTPPGLPEGTACYIGKYRGRFLVYERTSALRLQCQRCRYEQSEYDEDGVLVLGLPTFVNPGDGDGFASVRKAKHFYTTTNPVFEAQNPDCATLRSLVEQLRQPAGQQLLKERYAHQLRDMRPGWDYPLPIRRDL